jgi:CRP-like cAMP-binding protein
MDEETLKAMVHDEHEVVCETAVCLLMRAHQLESREQTGLVTVERMMALRTVPLFASLAPPDLARLAEASIEREFPSGKTLCVEGEPGDEAFVLLSGEVKVQQSDGAEERVVGREDAGGFIEELAVLDSAPRAATVLAGAGGARVLCLKGKAFREVLRTNPSVVGEVIRALAARIRGTRVHPRSGETRGETSGATMDEAAESQRAGAAGPESTISAR